MCRAELECQQVKEENEALKKELEQLQKELNEERKRNEELLAEVQSDGI